MIDSEKFISDCKKGKCNRNTMITPQCKKEYKQEQCFDKYNKKLSKDKEKREQKFKDKFNKEYEEDEQWTEVRKQVFLRDKNQCQFCVTLTKEEYEVIKPNLWGVMKTLDPAHIFSRGAFPHLKYEVSNIVTLSRYIHSCLDNCMDPFTQERIGKEEAKEYWIRIIGEEKYKELEERSRKHGRS